MTETLAVEVKRIRFSSDDTKKHIFEGITTIQKTNSTGKQVKAKSRETFKGVFMSLFTGDELSVTGYWQENERYGREFIVSSYTKTLPQTIKGIKTFLKQTARGVGDKKVKAIMDAYGEQALGIIAKDIHALDVIPKISQKQKENIWLSIAENIEFETLLSFMHLNNLDHTIAIQIYQRLKGDSVKRIQINPYYLYLEKITTFSISDQIAKNLDKSPGDRRRLYAGLFSFIEKDVEFHGNLYTQVDFIKKYFEQYLKKYGKFMGGSWSDKEIQDGLHDLESDGRIVFDHNEHDEQIVYLKNNLYVENKIVEHLKRKVNNHEPNFRYRADDIENCIKSINGSAGLKMSQNQKDAIKTSLKEMVSIITGGPGTGKTQTMAVLIQCIKQLSPAASIFLCSPTGKAAKRMSEMSGMKSSTIHRMVKIFDTSQRADEMIISGDFLIVDEASMVDAFVFYRLVASLDNDIRLIILGDHEQLPSVGAGLILRDLIDSGMIKTTKLTEVFRQAKNSAIVYNSHLMIEGKDLQEMKLSKNKEGDFFFFPANSADEIQAIIMKIINRLQKNMNIPLASIQVLSPVRGTVLGTTNLNKIIQEQFNNQSDFIEVEDMQFSVGDKVIHTVNNYDMEVFNGETGVVDRLNYLDHNSLCVAFPDKDKNYPKWSLEELELAYAITVHKSQGSEFPVVIMPIHDMLLNGLHRNLLYTAATRAKSKVIFVGKADVFNKAIDTIRSDRRNSKVKEKLQTSLKKA